MGTIPNNKTAGGLFGKTRQAILSLLYRRPEEAFYTRQILEIINTGNGSVQRELRNLTDSGVITRTTRGNLVYYQASPNCPFYQELKDLVQKMKPDADSITGDCSLSFSRIKAPPEKLAAFCRKHHIRKMSFFGSVLRDDFTPESDIDVLVDFEPGFVPGFAIIDIENELSRLLQRKADLRTTGDLSRYIRDRVVREARTAYEA
jgi:predicted nucleotidyltransferase/DNA-binding PadR family transcriptional regulator